MIVPQYWAESRARHRQAGRQVTVRRFGWSDNSQEEAQAAADLRAKEALERILSGAKLARREPKVPYNGADGVPIREEILSRHGETVITRNAYGAHCLNTPNVLFVDIDFDDGPSWRSILIFYAVLLVAPAIVGLMTRSSKFSSLFGLAALLLCIFVGSVWRPLWRRFRGEPEDAARRRVEHYLMRNPNWSVRLYRTPAGLRVLAMHQPFAPGDPAVADCFRALGADPIYSRMCLNQQCFRARVTAKPWRIGIGHHMRPQPGVWPVAPERIALREAWIAEYEAAAPAFAACRFIETLGSGVSHAETRRVQELHDELSRANSSLPIA
jgi:hypothetical protein